MAQKKLPVNPKPAPWLAPWIAEIIALALVVFQEGFRLESRTAHRVLPIPPSLQSFYYYHFGDFSNGFVNAFIVDGLVDTLLVPMTMRLRYQPRLLPSPQVRLLIAVLASVAIVVAFEVVQNSITQSDLADIPAGIAGACAYFLVRLFALRVRNRLTS